MKDILFADADTASRKNDVAMRLIQPRLWIPGGDYPGHLEWRDKAIEELKLGNKLSKLVYWGNQPVGSILYQQHKDLPTAVELKNFSLDDSARGRHFSSFLLYQFECELSQEFPDTSLIIGDTKQTNTEFLGFMAACGYSLSEPQIAPGSYEHNQVPDVFFSKAL